MKYSTDFPTIQFGHFPLNENSSYLSGDLTKFVIIKMNLKNLILLSIFFNLKLLLKYINYHIIPCICEDVVF